MEQCPWWEKSRVACTGFNLPEEPSESLKFEGEKKSEARVKPAANK